MQKKILKFWIVVAVLFFSALTNGMCYAAVKADLAWPESDGARTEIYYNAYRDGSWTGKTQITNNQYNNMHPEMAISDNGTVFLVWTALNGMQNKLFFSIKTSNNWTFPKEIETGLQSNIGPTIVLDTKGKPWIAWAGYDGVADDVYVSYWKEENWSKPQQVNPANKVPDILPEINLSADGLLQVTWQGYDGERYQYYQSTLQGEGWSEPLLLPENDAAMKSQAMAETSDNIVPLPESFHPIKQDERLYNFIIR